MKKLIVIICSLTLTSIVSAEEKTKEEGPCKKVMAACKAADFAKGDHKMKKGLFKDCMQPLLAGQTVTGVVVEADVLSACKAIKDAKHKTK